jgi:Ca-activated chloride channel family protein
MLDISGSMEDKISLARAAMAQFADNLRADDVMSIYQFSDNVKQLQDFSNSHDVSDYVWDIKAKGMTMIYDCLIDADDALSKREERRRAVLLISDGMDNHSSHKLDDAIKKTLGANVSVYSVDLIDTNGHQGPDEMQGHSVMKQMAEKTGGRYLATPGGTHLSDALAKVIEELRSEYTVGYYSNNDKRDGKWRKLEVTVPRPDVSVHARAGYFAPKDK